ncbi:hypothetical protein LIER_26141 [Lithospermum erythrorhizon]|uniref:Uncharacterized protein n=1 Tax=Lithospermum erythrorhizon TaxID=34254 RepID=A0AAV3R7C5_LITER
MSTRLPDPSKKKGLDLVVLMCNNGVNLIGGSLPHSWETLSVSLSASAVDGTLTKEMISNAIFNEDNRRGSNNTSKNNLNSDTLVFEKKKWAKKKGKLNQANAKNKTQDQCHYCDKIVHWKSDCYTFKRNIANGTIKNKKA